MTVADVLDAFAGPERAIAERRSNIASALRHRSRSSLALLTLNADRRGAGQLETLQPQMYGRTGVELLGARLMPLSADLATVQRE